MGAIVVGSMSTGMGTSLWKRIKSTMVGILMADSISCEPGGKARTLSQRSNALRHENVHSTWLSSSFLGVTGRGNDKDVDGVDDEDEEGRNGVEEH